MESINLMPRDPKYKNKNVYYIYFPIFTNMDASQESSSFNFQRIVMVIAIIMLIAALIFIGYALYAQTSTITWPPEIPKCPDYWTVDASGNCVKPSQPINCEYNGIPAGTQGMPACPK
jgi:hypothetical protein